ncbi:MAG: twin-arginine translocation signal domain-containing protein, partial [Verrucomicrobiae bacterium]|nr:twin-arginine translocation signal domain-containing protein [Verrucomicrobiae bacterium]
MPENADCCGSAHFGPLAESRRRFLKTAAAGMAAGATARLWSPASLMASPRPSDASETLAAQLHKSLTEEQRRVLCFAFDDPLREKVDNNWLITGKPISQVLSADQQDLVQQIYRQLHAPEFADRAMAQMVHDSEGKGFNGGTSVALFGQPDSGQFELVITGRHCTRRCDGDSVAGTAFGGPI